MLRHSVVVGALCGNWVILWWVHYMVVGPFRGGPLGGGYTMWWLGLSVVGLSVVGHCVVGHCAVGAQCGGYAMVVNVPNPARLQAF